MRQKPQVLILHGDIATPIVLPTPVKDFVLQQQVNGGYTIVSNLTSTQKSQVSAWPVAAGLILLTSDLNFDGFKDLYIRGIEGGSLGLYNQIVFSPTGQNSTPSKIRKIDTDFKSFFADAYRWIENANYFENASLVNGWYSVEEGNTFVAWWRVGYLMFWGYEAPGGTSFFEEYDEIYDSANEPYGCWTLYDCWYTNGQWYIWAEATEYTLVYDDFNDHFNPDAVTFGKAQHGSLRDLIDDIEIKMDIEIGGAEIPVVSPDEEIIDDTESPFWQDLLMRIELHDVNCALWPEICSVEVEDVTRVDMYVERSTEGSYQSSCNGGTRLNYTGGEYTVVDSNGLNLSGFTLERGGPDSSVPARNSEVCSNKPRRIPEGVYKFTMGSTNNYSNVPIVDSSSFSRTGILVHNSSGAYGTIGCILVGKKDSSSGVFAATQPYGSASASSKAALNEIREALTYETQGVRKFLYSYGWIGIENNIQ